MLHWILVIGLFSEITPLPPNSLPHKTTPQTTLSCLGVTPFMELCYW